jgi:hypothetical protein
MVEKLGLAVELGEKWGRERGSEVEKGMEVARKRN